jgi:hypothetical protein
MTLVVPMLTSVGSLVTRKQLVADLYTEVLAGQGYLLSALGCISAPLVDVRRLEEVLDRLEPLLSLLQGGSVRAQKHAMQTLFHVAQCVQTKSALASQAAAVAPEAALTAALAAPPALTAALAPLAAAAALSALLRHGGSHDYGR